MLRNPFRKDKVKNIQEGIFKVKSIMLGRKQKVMGSHLTFISLFSVNNPHLSVKAPEKMFDYIDITNVHINGLITHYLPTGNDLVIDNLKSVEISKRGTSLYISGIQKFRRR